MSLKKLVNRSAVKAAFHAKEARLPRGFIEALEHDLRVLLGRISDGTYEASPPSEEETGLYIKVSCMKDALRLALDKPRVPDLWVSDLNRKVAEKVSEALVRSVAQGRGVDAAISVPGRVARAFIRSKEHKGGFTFSKFFLLWQHDRAFREEWVERAKYKGQFLKTLVG